MAQTNTKPDAQLLNRRRFIAQSLRLGCGVGVLGVGLSQYANQSVAHAPSALRPPGALAEKQFLSACVRCGLCVQDCPYDTLKLAEAQDAVAIGTPYFEARKIPCEMCEDIPCVKACPSGALDPQLLDIDDARMGLAILIDRETCLNMQGLRCDVCYRVCPLIDEAITLNMFRNTRTGSHAVFEPVVNSDYCTGCGKCEQSCVLDEAAIKVVSRDLAKGRGGDFYQFGWKEKDKAGGALVPNIMDLPDRMPEGGLQ